MKKIFFLPIFITLLISLFFSIGSLNQTFAAGNGEQCSVRINGGGEPNGGCDTGLHCDTQFVPNYPNNCGKTENGSCAGICRAPCSYDVQDSTDPNADCNSGNNSGDYICYGSANGPRTVSGYCIPKTAHYHDVNAACTRTTASDTEGDCLYGLICNTDATHTNQGTCLPPSSSYTCDFSRDTRTGIKTTSGCLGGFTCAETRGKVFYPADDSGPQMCLAPGTYYTPGDDIDTSCKYECVPTASTNVICTCFSQGDASSSNGKDKGNGFTCSNTINTKTTTVVQACESTDYACYTDPNKVITGTYNGLSGEAYNTLKKNFGDLPITGISCQTPAQHNGTESVPPAPPCADNPPSTDGTCNSILTAFGAVPTNPAGFISKLFGILLGAAGSIALILIMRAGYRIMTARGNPEGIKEGREQLVAAIIGLMFLIFSFVLLQVIGVDLLRLPSRSATGIGGTCDVNNPQCASGLICRTNGGQGQCQKP